jgi:transcriptional regulator with XRE-family HTH domain
MDNRAQVREFLISRRERISPAQAGLPAYGGANRRVKGLRREEVALVAGVSIDYYVRMERGHLAGASDAVLEGIAGALRLDEAERAHLFDLARAAQPAPPRQRRTRTSGVTDGIQQVLGAITDAPAWVRNARHDMLAANRWPARCTPRCSPTRTGRSTTPASCTSASCPRAARSFAPGGPRTTSDSIAPGTSDFIIPPSAPWT